MAENDQERQKFEFLDKTGLATLWARIKELFATADHTHEYTEIVGLQDELDKKVNASDLQTLTIGEKTYDTTEAVEVTLTDLNVYSKDEVDQIKSDLEEVLAVKLTNKVVESLPAIGEADSKTIYLVPNNKTEGGNVYDEYIVSGEGESAKFELIGSSATDLDNYYTKDETDAKFIMIADMSAISDEDIIDICTLNEAQ